MEGLLKRRALSRVAWATSLVLVLAGCFKYVPTDFATAPVGEDVRLVVNRERVVDLSELALEDDPVPILQGTLIRREDTSLVVRIPVGMREVGFHALTLGQSIRVPADAIISAELRVLDGPETAGVLAGTVAAAVALLFLGMEAINDQAPIPGEDPPDLRLNLISIPIG